MPVILVIGPSHAGKSTLLEAVVGNHRRYGLQKDIVRISLDSELGSRYRSDGNKATEIVISRSRSSELVLADCGAGQISFSSSFRSYVANNMKAVIAVWCDEQTFRKRHNLRTVENEIKNNYKPELVELWEAARAHGHLVDTSGDIAPEQSAKTLAKVLAGMIDLRAWIAA